MIGAISAARSAATRILAALPASRILLLSLAPRYPPSLAPRLFRRRQGGLGPRRDHVTFFFGNHRHYSDSEAVGSRHVRRHEIHTRLLEAKQEMSVTA
jgi:hypothetical protein